MWKIIFGILCAFWAFAFIIVFMYLYLKKYKPYEHEYNEQFSTKIPSNLTPAELSLLMYQRITYTTFSSIIIKLLTDGVLLIEEIDGIKYIVKNVDKVFKLSKAEAYTLNILLDVIGDGSKVKIDRNNLCTKKKKCCDVLLNEYKIWCRIIRKESLNKNFYEQKTEYNLVKRITFLGIVLFAANILFKFHNLLGYIILVPAIFIYVFFLNIYKRTKEANEEYYKWLAFKRYLDNIEKFNFKEKDINNYLIYATILNVKGLEQKLNNNNIYSDITYIMNTNIINAILRGNRYL